MKKSINGLVYDEDKMTKLVCRDTSRNGLPTGSDYICKTPGGNYAVLTTTDVQVFGRHHDIQAIDKDEIASYISGWSITDEEAATLITEGILRDA